MTEPCIVYRSCHCCAVPKSPVFVSSLQPKGVAFICRNFCTDPENLMDFLLNYHEETFNGTISYKPNLFVWSNAYQWTAVRGGVCVCACVCVCVCGGGGGTVRLLRQICACTPKSCLQSFDTMELCDFLSLCTIWEIHQNYQFRKSSR
jgi:hypothetical protein